MPLRGIQVQTPQGKAQERIRCTIYSEVEIMTDTIRKDKQERLKIETIYRLRKHSIIKQLKNPQMSKIESKSIDTMIRELLSEVEREDEAE